MRNFWIADPLIYITTQFDDEMWLIRMESEDIVKPKESQSVRITEPGRYPSGPATHCYPPLPLSLPPALPSLSLVSHQDLGCTLPITRSLFLIPLFQRMLRSAPVTSVLSIMALNIVTLTLSHSYQNQACMCVGLLPQASAQTWSWPKLMTMGWYWAITFISAVTLIIMSGTEWVWSNSRHRIHTPLFSQMDNTKWMGDGGRWSILCWTSQM